MDFKEVFRLTKVDFFSGIGIMVFSAIVFIIAEGMPKADLGVGPGDYPKFFAAFLFILGLSLAFQSYLKGIKKDKKFYSGNEIIHIIALLLLTFAYLWAIPHIGFLYLTPFYLIAAMLLFGAKNFLVMSTVSIGFSAAVYWLFTTYFQVMLPGFTLF
jgi:hypothetical protein